MFMPDSTTFALVATDLEEAVDTAIEHLKTIATDELRPGFVVPELVREAIEFRDGEWVRTFRFRAELLPAGA
ncbi:hypothetical protein [Homoserinibacter sp. GY 40078]|uniref:hypothetical protein n=1 Tax=Homoserinibacter sp. GY 40078 TaxID=2603275 RepID=UPI0011CA1947|nr:hypothetical protein [Homoserinibacter sp. GY 40078]TXK17395.1 hypothetical protein FVQ89_11210 [Homoserinibacter sp. GY 40078]